jgi:hypothetical protein
MPATMQHKVTSFFRSHSMPFDHSSDVKKGPRQNSSNRPTITGRTPSSTASVVSGGEEKSSKMHDSHKRLSLTALHSPKGSTKSIPHHQGASVDCVIESPPLVFYGTTTTSTGALLSGQLKLAIHDESFAVDSFKMRLAVEVTQKKPFHAHCHECTHQSTDLTTWNFLQGPATLRKGMRKHSPPNCVAPSEY